RRYSQDFVADEAVARSAKRGIWRSAFLVPWEWRAQRRGGGGAPGGRPAGLPAAVSGPPRARSGNKGKHNSQGGRSSHLPGGRDYATTVIDSAHGERWFCSEAEARAAGWRPAKQ